MTPVCTSHIWLDADGRAWIDETNVKVAEVALDMLAYGWSPEEIFHQHYGHLSLAQIHAALAYFYDHRAKFDAEIESQLREVEHLRAAQGQNTPLHRKLRAAGKIP